MRAFFTQFRLLGLGLFFISLSSCTPSVIPQTDVQDTPANRSIVEFCELYRNAVEHKKVGFLMSIAHPKYYENGGNIDATDDIDRAGLKDFLVERFGETQAIRYEIRYRRIQLGNNDKIFVDYTYTASYRIPGTDGEDVWRRKVEDNRLELVPNQDSYLILSGM